MICFSRAAVIRQVSVVSQSVRFSEKALPGSKRKLRNHRIPQKFYVLFFGVFVIYCRFVFLLKFIYFIFHDVMSVWLSEYLHSWVWYGCNVHDHSCNTPCFLAPISQSSPQIATYHADITFHTFHTTSLSCYCVLTPRFCHLRACLVSSELTTSPGRFQPEAWSESLGRLGLIKGRVA